MTTHCNLGDLVDRTGDPEKIALIDLVDPAVPREVSHRELDAGANAVARALAARGFPRASRVAILSANRMEFLTAYFGIMRAGLVAVPVNYRFPHATIRFILDDCDAVMAFADPERRASCPAGLPVVVFQKAGGDGFDAFLDPGPFEAVRPEADEIAMFLYTSGSTGRPKGVPLSHAGQLWVVEVRLSTGIDFQPHRFLVAAPLYHMNALMMSKMAVAAHASMVLLPEFDVCAYIEAIARFRCTYLTSVPTMLAMVVREKALLARTDLTSVAAVTMGSAPVTAKLLQGLREAFPGAAINHRYGTTEAGAAVFGRHPDGAPQPELALGYPLPGVGARLVDGDDEDAEEGVLQLKTPAVMPGYHKLEGKTAECLTLDGWYNTRDLMRRDENGFYYFLGRADDMFVCGGENIYPGEIERLLERHPEIQQACVVPVPDEIKGAKPVAFVVPRSGTEPEEAAVKAYALANAPAYQHPRRVYVMEALPLTGTNKVDRNLLADRAAADALEAAAE